MRLSICLLLLAPGVLMADGLGDLRAALSRLPAKAPVRVQAECSAWSQSSEGKGAESTQERDRVILDAGPSGLGITREDPPAGTVPGGRESERRGAISSSQAGRLVDGAAELLRTLEKASQKEDRPGTWQGRPARELLLALDADMDAEDRRHLKRFERTLRVWLDPQGLPLASEELLDLKGRVYLIGFEVHARVGRTYLQHGDRLLITWEESDGSGSGMGHRSQGRKVLTTRLL